MSVVRVTELPESGQASVTDTGGREYTRSFRVEFDSFEDTGLEAMLAIPIVRFERYISPNGDVVDNMALADTAQAHREDETSYSWIVEVPYSTKLWEEILKAISSGGTGITTGHPGSPHGNNQDPTSPENPINRPWKISLGTTTVRRRMTQDRAATPKGIVNSAGDPIYYETEVKLRTITVNRNIAPPSISDQLLWETLYNKTNDSTFLSRTTGTVRCDSIDGSFEYENGYLYFAQTCQFTVNTTPDAWTLKLMDNGTHQLDAATGKTVPIRDVSTGQAVTEPWPLDGAGHALSEADRAAGNFHYLEFEEYPQDDFSVLGFPGSL